MKKAFKIIGIILLVIVAVLVILIVVASKKQFVPEGYENTVKTGGKIEKYYLQKGTYDVSYKEYPLLQGFTKFEIYYPSELVSKNKKYPLVVMCNGSGLPASKYPNLFKHLASWGFVVIGTEEEYDWSGFSAEMCIRFLLDIDGKQTLGDKDEGNPFYQKIDFNRVGITGHSQGGVGVFNAISVQEHSSIYKAAVALSPTKTELAENLYWHYDVSGIQIPIFLLSGTDEAGFIEPDTLKAIYDSFPEDTNRVMATRNSAEHNDMLYFSDGYVTAWFMWQLQGDEEAAKAFIGGNPEVLNNSLYQNQKINMAE